MDAPVQSVHGLLGSETGNPSSGVRGVSLPGNSLRGQNRGEGADPGSSMRSIPLAACEALWQPSGRPAHPLSGTRLYGCMFGARGSAILISVLLLLCATAWALVIWVALQVSTIVLNTLHQIVELAQMS